MKELRISQTGDETFQVEWWYDGELGRTDDSDRQGNELTMPYLIAYLIREWIWFMR